MSPSRRCRVSVVELLLWIHCCQIWLAYVFICLIFNRFCLFSQAWSDLLTAIWSLKRKNVNIWCLSQFQCEMIIVRFVVVQTISFARGSRITRRQLWSLFRIKVNVSLFMFKIKLGKCHKHIHCNIFILFINVWSWWAMHKLLSGNWFGGQSRIFFFSNRSGGRRRNFWRNTLHWQILVGGAMHFKVLQPVAIHRIVFIHFGTSDSRRHFGQ